MKINIAKRKTQLRKRNNIFKSMKGGAAAAAANIEPMDYNTDKLLSFNNIFNKNRSKILDINETKKTTLIDTYKINLKKFFDDNKITYNENNIKLLNTFLRDPKHTTKNLKINDESKFVLSNDKMTRDTPIAKTLRSLKNNLLEQYIIIQYNTEIKKIDSTKFNPDDDDDVAIDKLISEYKAIGSQEIGGKKYNLANIVKKLFEDSNKEYFKIKTEIERIQKEKKQFNYKVEILIKSIQEKKKIFTDKQVKDTIEISFERNNISSYEHEQPLNAYQSRDKELLIFLQGTIYLYNNIRTIFDDEAINNVLINMYLDDLSIVKLEDLFTDGITEDELYNILIQYLKIVALLSYAKTIGITSAYKKLKRNQNIKILSRDEKLKHYLYLIDKVCDEIYNDYSQLFQKLMNLPGIYKNTKKFFIINKIHEEYGINLYKAAADKLRESRRDDYEVIDKLPFALYYDFTNAFANVYIYTQYLEKTEKNINGLNIILFDMENILVGILEKNQQYGTHNRKKFLDKFTKLLENYIASIENTLFILVSKDEIFTKINNDNLNIVYNNFEKNNTCDLYNIYSVNKAINDILINNDNKQNVINEINLYRDGNRCRNDRTKNVIDYYMPFGNLKTDSQNISSELDDYTIALLIKNFRDRGIENVFYVSKDMYQWGNNNCTETLFANNRLCPVIEPETNNLRFDKENNNVRLNSRMDDFFHAINMLGPISVPQHSNVQSSTHPSEFNQTYRYDGERERSGSLHRRRSRSPPRRRSRSPPRRRSRSPPRRRSRSPNHSRNTRRYNSRYNRGYNRGYNSRNNRGYTRRNTSRYNNRR